MAAKNWSKEQIRLASTYGTCPTCGEPRTIWDIEEAIIGQPDSLTHVRKLVCSAEPMKHPQP